MTIDTLTRSDRRAARLLTEAADGLLVAGRPHAALTVLLLAKPLLNDAIRRVRKFRRLIAKRKAGSAR